MLEDDLLVPCRATTTPLHPCKETLARDSCKETLLRCHADSALLPCPICQRQSSGRVLLWQRGREHGCWAQISRVRRCWRSLCSHVFPPCVPDGRLVRPSRSSTTQTTTELALRSLSPVPLPALMSSCNATSTTPSPTEKPDVGETAAAPSKMSTGRAATGPAMRCRGLPGSS